MRAKMSHTERCGTVLLVLAGCGLFMLAVSLTSCEQEDGDSASSEEIESVEEVACDAVAWVEQAREAFSYRGQEGSLSTEVGPPPYDEHCIPVIDKSCQVVCDCKFVKLHRGKFIVGATKSVPWDEWPRVGPNLSTGLCDDGSGIFIDPVPAIGAFELLCQDGECRTVETGNSGADDEGLKKYIDEKNEIWKKWRLPE